MRYQFTAQDASRGGQAVVKKHGRRHMSRIGKLGYQATVNKYFDGDQDAANAWLAKKGHWFADKDASYGPVFADPGPHPAWGESDD